MLQQKKVKRNWSQRHPIPVSTANDVGSTTTRRGPQVVGLACLKQTLPLELKHVMIFQGDKANSSESPLEDERKAKPNLKICYLAPVLAHPCELEIWNESCRRMDAVGIVITSLREQPSIDQFLATMEETASPLALEFVTLESEEENPTFLAGVERYLKNTSFVVAYGEASLASYQALKARSSRRFRMAVWQNAPRPPDALPQSQEFPSNEAPSLKTRSRTVRREVLRAADVLVTFDKDSATWAYLEDVSAQRIRRVNRGLNTQRFKGDLAQARRRALRELFGFAAEDFLFLQSGALELESGALDTVFAFKNLLQSHPALASKAKLVFCGTGRAAAQIRQTVVELELDSQVFFLSPASGDRNRATGNHLASLVSLADVIVHNPLNCTNGSPLKALDCNYDVMCALASGITVVSNGSGWVGEWLSRYYRAFSAGSIHAQARLMHESFEKQQKLANLKKAICKAIENEHSLEQAASEVCKVFASLLSAPVVEENQDIKKVLDLIERTVQSKQYSRAIELIQSAFAIEKLGSTEKSQLFRHIGDCFTKLGDLENGLQNYARALELDAYCAKTYIGLGTIALQTKTYHIAVPQFQKAVSLAPHDDMAALGLGLAFEGLGEPNEALKWTARACRLNDESTVALYQLVKLSYDLEEFHPAEEILSCYVARHPNDVNMLFTLGGMAYKGGDSARALALMNDILRLDPMNARAHSLVQQIQRENNPNRIEKSLRKQA
jgi:tetratricopeptide (TPR) repeat protein